MFFLKNGKTATAKTRQRAALRIKPSARCPRTNLSKTVQKRIAPSKYMNEKYLLFVNPHIPQKNQKTTATPNMTSTNPSTCLGTFFFAATTVMKRTIRQTTAIIRRIGDPKTESPNCLTELNIASVFSAQVDVNMNLTCFETRLLIPP